ncbi:hypothetical protein ISS30_01985 [bacterium]|nr:hypothetical protein [FCB group bacterium]MBL7190436.1 hypothetical protein [bacterium]
MNTKIKVRDAPYKLEKDSSQNLIDIESDDLSHSQVFSKAEITARRLANIVRI